jgi:DNA-binding LacI/PurR family transcriptional regulator
MQDVAREAGVNRVTVSVVLNNAKANTQVSEATRLRILETARRLGYHRNARALALKRQATDVIGYYAGYNPNLHDPFTAEVINSMQQAANRLHKDMLVMGQYPGRSVQSVFSMLMSGKIDGLVMIPEADTALMESIAGSNRPVVAIADEFPGLPSVVMDDARGATLMAEYLAGRGHQRVLYRADVFKHTSANTRREAFLEAAGRLGMRVVVGGSAAENAALTDEEKAILTGRSPDRPTAVACWADTNAYSCLEGCLDLGLRVPQDVAVAGFDGIPTRIRPFRCLTTIRAPWNEAAARALHLVCDLIEGQPAPLRTVFPVELLVGDTA